MPQYAEVYVEGVGGETDRPFDYIIPESLLDKVKIGVKVTVPFGARKVKGYVTAVKDQCALPSARLRPILQVLTEPLFDEGLADLARWVADYYCCRMVEALQAITPSGAGGGDSWIGLSEQAQQNFIDCVTFLEGEDPALAEALLILAEAGGGLEAADFKRRLRHQGTQEVISGLLARDLIYFDRRGKAIPRAKTARLLTAAAELACAWQDIKAPKQKAVAEFVLRNPGPYTAKELAAKTGVSLAVIQSLVSKGMLTAQTVEVRRSPLVHIGGMPPTRALPTLTAEQQRAFHHLSRLLADETKKPVLLFGVTGSGKTEIYLRLIDQALQNGRGAIFLVPEISLTPQMIRQCRERFGDGIAILHSHLSAGERFDEWKRIKTGEARVALGARSAIFAPVQNLGLVIIDEEHEASYKQGSTPRYHAREVAKERARREKALLLLGSATPSMESFYAAESGEYERITLRERVNKRPLPPVELVDLRKEFAENNRSIFSRSLRRALQETIDAGEQAILFLNRRGFASFALCRACGYVPRCPRCGTSLPYHAPEKRLFCHACGYRQPVPKTCPECGSPYIRFFGAGTQRVEDEVHRLFPGVKTLRMDMDTTSRKGMHEQILEQFRQREASILIGTQMVGKGLDFPGVTLVGVISADVSLNLPDFRAGERTFELMTQVAGRAGRGTHPGRVIIQTYNPEHVSLQAAKNHDYLAFYREEIGLREMLAVPPFTRLIHIVVSGEDHELTQTAATVLYTVLRDFAAVQPDILVSPACPAPISRVRNRYRWQILTKGTNLIALRSMVKAGMNKAYGMKEFSMVNVSVDVEALDTL